jgi:hypothetical protein
MGLLVGHGGRLEGNIRSGYPLPWHCNDGRGIGNPARRFTAMTDLGTNVIITVLKSGDATTFCPVAASLSMNLQIIAGDGFVL